MTVALINQSSHGKIFRIVELILMFYNFCCVELTVTFCNFQDAIKSCLYVNAPLLYRAACQVPFSVLKYAMTLDGEPIAYDVATTVLW